MPSSTFEKALINVIPRNPEKVITMVAMAEKLPRSLLGNLGLPALRKKIQNNLKAIDIADDCLEIDKSSPRAYLYRFKADVLVSGGPISQEQMMAFGLLSKYGTDLLTDQAHRALSPFFEAAKQTAVSVAEGVGFSPRKSSSLGRQWLGKIAVLPAVLPFCPPTVSDKVRVAVGQALLLEKKLKLKIRRSPSNEEEEVVVNPLGLVQQGVRTYLVAKRVDKTTADYFPLMRIISAVETFGSLEKPANWDLQKFLSKGIGHQVFEPEIYGKPHVVEIKIDAESQWLKETPLAKDPLITELKDGSYTMQVEIPITEELVHWLLSMAFHVKVLQPEFLVQRLKSDLKKSARMYG